jgi:hypothetical protein
MPPTIQIGIDSAMTRAKKVVGDLAMAGAPLDDLGASREGPSGC